ncbi:uncharacterized protein LOC116308748 [Actinia tenebrosa]|uniref:Uncharacterized protein LOC116308748 n=1 Tax=Actinia tenebrosa TaxID=6105 RepID=A0A6P8JFJ6_ACTTE|nr:uncharacterized protein LOC116308748 [Actinia tenebrosa]
MAEKYELELRERKNKRYAIKIPKYDRENAQRKVLSKLEKKLCLETNLYGLTFKRSIIGKEDLEKSIPILVFCFLTSRIGEDINVALDEVIVEGIDKDDNIILVLVHFKRKFTLKDRTLSYDDNLLEEERHVKLRERERIVHFAFHSDDEGLYEHPENKKGMKRLVELIKSSSK